MLAFCLESSVELKEGCRLEGEVDWDCNRPTAHLELDVFPNLDIRGLPHVADIGWQDNEKTHWVFLNDLLEGFSVKLIEVDEGNLSEDVSFEVSSCEVKGVAEGAVVVKSVSTGVLDESVCLEVHASL